MRIGVDGLEAEGERFQDIGVRAVPGGIRSDIGKPVEKELPRKRFVDACTLVNRPERSGQLHADEVLVVLLAHSLHPLPIALTPAASA